MPGGQKKASITTVSNLVGHFNKIFQRKLQKVLFFRWLAVVDKPDRVYNIPGAVWKKEREFTTLIFLLLCGKKESARVHCSYILVAVWKIEHASSLLLYSCRSAVTSTV